MSQSYASGPIRDAFLAVEAALREGPCRLCEEGSPQGHLLAHDAIIAIEALQEIGWGPT